MSATVSTIPEARSVPHGALSLRELHAALRAARAGQFASAGLAALQTGGGDSGVVGGPLSPPFAPRVRATAPSQRRRPTRPSEPVSPNGATVRLLAAHGGSGAHCLARLLQDALVIEDWPDAAPGAPTDLSGASSSPIVLVGRSHARGLAAVQARARQHRDGAARAGLLGAVIVADAPGRLPTSLRRRQRLLAAAVPALWQVPWTPAWRMSDPDPADPPGWAATLTADIRAAQALLTGSRA